ncbi:plasmid mobilization protein [Pseudohoeflea coraliihabitans]|uniref:Plasmid mobilization relaxosome protein MobC n=1 Tax=Pseudohoeflea coraliihabitans TaxID=2860393 RepID=A0ABS6WTH8_9HYPH|nr:plasmid mobilization relaxosome protein MobC [Pseudohoeflea sp. DP4N28-3]MBW3099266.1 plasmid mobilization relaxosome protein MobC [Pseudohoeflea sp. DP4N28-3]
MTERNTKGGRPKKAPGEQRSERLSGVSLTPAERHHVEAQAERAGLPVSEFCRRAILGQRIRPRRSASDDRLLVELNRVGVNLHQIVRALNFKKGIPRDIDEAIQAVTRVVEKVAADGS